MYMPTWEKFIAAADEYMSSEAVSALGYFVDGRIAGVIVIVELDDKVFEIKGIAVDFEYRKQGIGKRLIRHVCSNFQISYLTAETDEDTVHFYKKCGFEAERFVKMGENGEYVRYKIIAELAEEV
jgi:ribosomal protein S18 acetylase RimI-like enzyme